MRDDQVMLGVDGGLHVVADDAGALAAGGHRACVRVGQRDLLVGRVLDRLLHGAELLSAPDEFSPEVAD